MKYTPPPNAQTNLDLNSLTMTGGSLVNNGQTGRINAVTIDSYILDMNSGIVSPQSGNAYLGIFNDIIWVNGGVISTNIFVNTNSMSLAVQGMTTTPGQSIFDVQDSSGTYNAGIIYQGPGKNSPYSSPNNAAAPATALALNTVWHNPNTWDITLQVILAITANTSLVISAGVGSSTPPTMIPIISGTTLTGIVPVILKVPGGYYAEITTSGVGTVTIVGQIEFSG